MARNDRPFQVIEMVGNNAYKLQLLRDMAISTTFNIGDLSPYVKDTLEDPSNLRPNPSEGGEDDAGACQQRDLKGSKAQGNQERVDCPTKLKYCPLFLAPKLVLFWEAILKMIS